MKLDYDKKRSEKIWTSFYSRNDPQTKLVRFLDNNYFSYAFRQSLNTILPFKGSIMEAGCGEGMISARLAKERYTITLLDISEQALEAAKTNVDLVTQNKKVKVKYIQGDIFKLPFKDNTFDVVWNQGVLEHFSNPESAISQMYRVTKKSGHVAILVPYVYSPLHLYDIALRKMNLTKFWPFEEQIFYSKKMLAQQLFHATKEKPVVKLVTFALGFSIFGYVKKSKN